MFVQYNNFTKSIDIKPETWMWNNKPSSLLPLASATKNELKYNTVQVSCQSLNRKYLLISEINSDKYSF